jgi:phosphoesterase RecJ-like protein
MRQKDKNSYKFSLRTNTDADMSLLCSNFGGGGHVKAAGCTIVAKTPKKAKQLFLEKAKEFII